MERPQPIQNPDILKIGHHAKAIAHPKSSPQVIAHAKSSLWVKNQNSKKSCKNPFYKSFTVIRCKKTLEKTPNIQIFNLPMQNPHFRSKIKIPKNMPKSILQIIQSCFLQKTTRKNHQYSRNHTNYKIGHHAKPINHPKS